jgi:hypothetical protein
MIHSVKAHKDLQVCSNIELGFKKITVLIVLPTK